MDGNSKSFKLADNVVIFAAKTSGDNFDFSDTDELSMVKRADVLNTDNIKFQAIYDEDSEVVALLMDNSATSDDQFGIATDTSTISVNGSSEKAVNFYIAGTAYTDQQLDDEKYPVVMDKTKNTSSTVLYKIKKTTSGKYSFGAVTDKTITTAAGVDQNMDTKKVKKLSKDKVTLSDDTNLTLASNVVIYTYDKSDDKITVSDYSSRADIVGKDVLNVTFYTNNDNNDDNVGLVDYVIIYQN